MTLKAACGEVAAEASAAGSDSTAMFSAGAALETASSKAISEREKTVALPDQALRTGAMLAAPVEATVITAALPTTSAACEPSALEASLIVDAAEAVSDCIGVEATTVGVLAGSAGAAGDGATGAAVGVDGACAIGSGCGLRKRGDGRSVCGMSIATTVVVPELRLPMIALT